MEEDPPWREARRQATATTVASAMVEAPWREARHQAARTMEGPPWSEVQNMTMVMKLINCKTW